MNENEKKEDSKGSKLSYMWRLYYNIAFLSDEIAGCINCCYNFDPLGFAIMLDCIYNGISDDEINAILERKAVSIFSDKNIIDIPSKEILSGFRKKTV